MGMEFEEFWPKRCLKAGTIETCGLYSKFSDEFTFMLENKVIKLTTLLLDELR